MSAGWDLHGFDQDDWERSRMMKGSSSLDYWLVGLILN